MDSTEPTQPGTTDQPHEHRLGLIVERMAGEDLVQPLWAHSRRLKQRPKESVPQFPRRPLYADMLLGRMLGHIIAVADEFQIVLARKSCNEFLIPIRFCSTQFVIEVNYKQDDP